MTDGEQASETNETIERKGLHGTDDAGQAERDSDGEKSR